MKRSLLLSLLALGLLFVLPACDCDVEGDVEGDEPGECSDGADNDQDGVADCDDDGCAADAACAGDDDDAGPEWSPPVYDGECPTFEAGLNEDFVSSGTDRRFRLALPDDPSGAPLLFAWHWLGGNSQQIMEWLALDDLAEDEGVIVVAPDSDGYPSEWRWDQPASGNVDALLFEDLLACLHQQFEVDLGRVHATGMSAGGLWTTWLIINESQWLASAAPLSGGVYEAWYATPEEPIPVMVVWGGPADTYGNFSFDVASRDFSEELQDDGHFVVECDHGGGHTVPQGAASFTWRFFEEHPKGLEAEPWADGLPSELPSYCVLP